MSRDNTRECWEKVAATFANHWMSSRAMRQLSSMEHVNNNRQSNGSSGASSELRVVAIKCNPGPDTEDRLRRLFTLLLKHAVGDRHTTPEEDVDEERE